MAVRYSATDIAKAYLGVRKKILELENDFYVRVKDDLVCRNNKYIKIGLFLLFVASAGYAFDSDTEKETIVSKMFGYHGNPKHWVSDQEAQDFISTDEGTVIVNYFL